MIAKRMSSVGECFISSHDWTYYCLILQRWVWDLTSNQRIHAAEHSAFRTSLKAL